MSNLKNLQGDIFEEKCPSREILKNIMGRWSPFILITLNAHKVQRFSELKKEIPGVSEKMLSQTLKRLEGHKIIRRKSFDVVPPYVEYSLTPQGKELTARFMSMTSWIEENLSKMLP